LSSERRETLQLLFAILSALAIGLSAWNYSHTWTLWGEFLIVSSVVWTLSGLDSLFIGISIVCLFGLTLVIRQNLPPMPAPTTSQQSVAMVNPSPLPVFGHKSSPFEPPRVQPKAALYLGTIGFGTALQGPIRIRGLVPFRCYSGTGRLICDFNTVSKGAPIVIRDNDPTTLPDGWKWNANDNAMEIVNEDETPVIQMIYENPMELHFYGIFAEDDTIVMASSHGLATAQMDDPRTPEVISRFRLNRLFKYPREVFPGVPN
jgi:hypothetical protein